VAEDPTGLALEDLTDQELASLVVRVGLTVRAPADLIALT
jgi:hypothetical protein